MFISVQINVYLKVRWTLICTVYAVNLYKYINVLFQNLKFCAQSAQVHLCTIAYWVLCMLQAQLYTVWDPNTLCHNLSGG